ncbi:MAG: DUF4091 domain-containing protein [Clostridia bacterium]|nr:DUF4091 domain-containing protein [Clostridia bacterium]
MKTRLFHKSLAAVLCVLLLLSALPLTASARQHYNLYIVYPDIQAKRDAGSSPYGGNTTDYYRQRLPFDGSYQCVYLAQNEAEGFQLFFYEWYDPRELHVSVSDFVNVSGEKLAHTVYREEYFTSTGVEDFPLADPLLPYNGEAVMTEPGCNRMFYIELQSAKNQTPGEYTATVTLSDENSVLTTRYIKATVWNFTLPEAHYATTIAGLYNTASGYGGTNNFLKECGVRFNGNEIVPEDVPLAESILEGWQEVLLEHGITTYELPRFLIDNDAKSAQLAMADTRRKAFAVPLLSYGLSGGSFNAATTARIQQYRDLVQGNAYLENKAFFYAADEQCWADETEAEAYNARIAAIEAIWPNYHAVMPINSMNTFTIQKLRDTTDILCMNQQLLHEYSDARTVFTDGTWNRTWRYQGDVQDGGFYFHRWGKSTMGVFSRILYWQASALGSDGILHWNAAFLPNDTDGEPYDVWEHMAIPPKVSPSTGNGDGTLVYPGYPIGLSQTKPVVSLRLKQIRDGMDDYDYLTMAKEFLGNEQWAEYINRVLFKYSESGINEIYDSEGIDWVGWECVTMNSARVAIGNALSEANTTHTYGDWQTVVEPDASHDGVQIRTCTACGAEESRTLTTHEHTFGDWTQTTAPTCTVEGKETRACTGCGVTETREIAPTGHVFGAYSGSGATCTADAQRTRTCAVCGVTDTLVQHALGHDWGDWTQTDPTCTEDGLKTRICVRCGETETAVLPSAGSHSFGEWTVTTEATCTADGSKARTCTVCSYEETETISALGHDFGDWVVTTPATGSAAGEETRTCSRCNTTETRAIPAIPAGYGYFSGGYGTAESPFLISNTADFDHIDDFYVEYGDNLPCTPVYFAQTSHLDLSVPYLLNYNEGEEEDEFEYYAATPVSVMHDAVYDGGGYEIFATMGITCFTDSAYSGIFGLVTDSTIRNLRVFMEGVTFTCTGANGCAGMIARAENCLFDTVRVRMWGDARILSSTGSANVGVLAGCAANCGVQNCLAQISGQELGLIGSSTSGFSSSNTWWVTDEYDAYDWQADIPNVTGILFVHEDYCGVTLEIADGQIVIPNFTLLTDAQGNVQSEPLQYDPTATGLRYHLYYADHVTFAAGEHGTLTGAGSAVLYGEPFETKTVTGLQPIPDAGYVFAGWAVSVQGSASNQNERSMTLQADGTYTYSTVLQYDMGAAVVTANFEAHDPHSFDAEVTAPTCTKGGYTTYTCSVCGYTYTADETAALGHNWVGQKDLMGNVHVVCTRCGEEKYTIKIDPWNMQIAPEAKFQLDHQTHVVLEDTIFQPDCTSNGLIHCACMTCGEEIFVEQDALGHDFGEWTVTTPATTSSEGEETRTCTRCQVTETRAINRLPAEPRFVVSDGRAKPGETVQITVSVENNPGIIAALLKMEYDPDVLTLTAVQNGDVFGDGVYQPGGNLSAIPYTTVWVDPLASANYTADGTLVTFTFTVAADAPVGTTPITVTYDTNSSLNTDLEYVAFTVQNNAVTVYTRLAGDADGDGEVSLGDVVSLTRFLAGGWNVTVDEGAADVDGDGLLSLKDVVLLRRYIAGGWGVELI